MTDVLIDRELLERVTKTCMFTMPADDYTELRAALAAPVQGVNTQLLEALEALEEAARQVMAEEMAASSIMVERMKARAAIAAARKGEGE